ncbi:hypothetical protein GN244_ATG12835 [Phytophthora infestans]|uniref:M96 mating-specific protein family n=1 Tax=Phytophthora infestans TaxID=4787 RepID=A0A833RX99_PHYIN|nr:hypothetical protein GN244_ATG12835 [Phytophthora infestans]KAF4134768.1 hypothetical protein GN958_ATG16024 [Phytophthora infestans]
MAMKAACAAEVHKALATSSPSKAGVLHEHGESDGLAVPRNLAPSVVSSCFSTDINANSSVGVVVQRKTRREKEAIRKRIYHQRLKDERETLRQTVEDLKLKLEELKQGKQTTSLGPFDSVWRDLAMEEREKLLQSEAEQRQLIDAAEAKAFCIMELCKQVPASMVKSVSSPTTVDSDVSVLPTIPPFDYTMFRGHLRRVQEAYALTDCVLNFDSMVDGVSMSNIRREVDNEVEYIELRQKYSEPFSYAQTQRTMWKLGEMHHRQHDRKDFRQVADSGDIRVIRYRTVQTLATGPTVSVLKRYVAQRFVEETRTVFIWKTHTEGEGALRGMHSDDTGWICVQPATDENVTDVMVCSRQAPVRFGISTSTDAQIEAFHQILQSDIHEDMVEITSALDKLLLEDTLAGVDM